MDYILILKTGYLKLKFKVPFCCWKMINTYRHYLNKTRFNLEKRQYLPHYKRCEVNWLQIANSFIFNCLKKYKNFNVLLRKAKHFVLHMFTKFLKILSIIFWTLNCTQLKIVWKSPHNLFSNSYKMSKIRKHFWIFDFFFKQCVI